MASSSTSPNGGIVSQKQQPEIAVVIAPATSTTSPQQPIVTRKNLQILSKNVDPNVQLDEETEDCLLNYADDVLEKIIEGACELAAHRKATAVDAQDLQLFLERQKNMWLSAEMKDGDSVKIPKKTMTTDAHKQRVALIKKTLKKF